MYLPYRAGASPMPTLTVMSPKSSIAIATCLPYSLLTMATYSVLWLPAAAIYFRYLYSTTAIYHLLWLPAVYYSHLHVVYYGYL